MSDLLQAAKDPTTPSSQLAALLWRTQDPEVHSLLAQNPNADRHTLLQLLPRFPREVSENPAFSLVLLESPAAISSLGEDSLLRLAANPETPSSLIRIMIAQCKSPIDFVIAQREDLTEEHLLALVGEGYAGIEALRHPKAGEAVWCRAASSRRCAKWLAQSPQSPLSAREILAQSEDLQVQQSLDWRDEPVVGYRSSLSYTGVTDKGLLRERNEDDLFLYQGDTLAVFAVFDAMCGKLSRTIASSTARELFFAKSKAMDGKPFHAQRFFFEVSTQIDAQIVADSTSFPDVTGYTKGKRLSQGDDATTLSALLFQGHWAYTANVGHSRVYLYRAGVLTQLTRDHTLHNDPSAAQLPIGLKAQAKNILMQSLGMNPWDAAPDLSRITTKPGDIFLLCTDGVHREITDDEISALLSAGGSLEEKQRSIVQQVFWAGARDNLALVLVAVG